jgi:hypothetical protein
MPSANLSKKIEQAKDVALQAIYYGYIPLIFALGFLSVKQQVGQLG